MATIVIKTLDIEHQIETTDLGAAIMVQHLGAAFAHAGGVWIPVHLPDTEPNDTQGVAEETETASLRWLPAASTTVRVNFTEGDVPEALADLPGYLTLN
ncbi:MAG: hypothetical protein QM747_17940 [Nocardioides sp.]